MRWNEKIAKPLIIFSLRSLKKKFARKLPCRYWKFLFTNSFWKFKHINVGHLKWGYLKIILVIAKLLQNCSRLLYMRSICRELVHRINILCRFCTHLCKIFMATMYRQEVLLFVDSLSNWNLPGAGWILHNYWTLHYWHLTSGFLLFYYKCLNF